MSSGHEGRCLCADCLWGLSESESDSGLQAAHHQRQRTKVQILDSCRQLSEADSAAPESTTQLTAPRTKVGMDTVLRDLALLGHVVETLGDLETGYAIISVDPTV